MQILNDKMKEKLNMKLKIKLMIVAFISIIFTYSLFGSSMTKTGMTAAPFLSIEVGARGKSMGGAFVGISDDISALFWNPAGITKLPKNAFMISHTKWIADVNFNFAGVTVPIGNYGTIGASLQTLVGGNITLFTELCEKSRSEAFEMMVDHSEQIGANAVIGIRYDTTELMDGVTEVLCYGTAVVVEPTEKTVS